MEDAAKALEIAGAMLIFIICLTLAFMMIGQTRATADAVFLSTDKTNYQEYAKNSPDASTTRIVGLETIIPTMYRYNNESLRIVIIDRSGKIVLVLDTGMEGQIINFPTKYLLPSIIESQIKTRVGQISLPEKAILGIDDDWALYKRYLESYTSVLNSSKVSNAAPWAGDKANINKRVDSILAGTDVTINSSTLLKYSQINFISKYKDSTFKEKVYTYKLSGQYYTEPTTGETYELVPGGSKKVIIYIQQ